MNDGNSHVLDLTAAYALGDLPPEDAAAVERHCKTCPPCAADLVEMAGIATALPLACEQIDPPAALKRRLVAAARADASARRFLQASTARRIPRVSPSWWAAAAAAVVLAGGFGAATLVDHQRMASEMAAMQQQLAVDQGAVTEIAAARRVWDMSGGTNAHWWHCTLVQPEQHKPPMLVALMPPAPTGMTFQAWIVRHGTPHNAGTLPAGTTSMMHLPMAVQKGDVIAFSVEPMGGSASPTMPFAMQQQLD